MRKLAIAVCLMIPVCCFGDQWNKHFDVSGMPDVHVEGGNVAVEVVSGTSSGVNVELKTREAAIGASGVHIEHQQSGNRLELRVVAPESHSFWHGDSIQVIVTVPKASRVAVHMSNGPLEIHDVAGPVHVDAGNGPIEVRGADGAVDVQTGNGPVNIHGRFSALELRMENGPLDLKAEQGSRMDSSWHIQTGNGPVDVKVPGDLHADLSLHMGNGPHLFNLPLAEQVGDRHDVQGKLNGGGPDLSIHTGNGPVSVSRD